MIEIIPAIDLIGGKCVRLVHGDFDRVTEYSAEPVTIAKKFAANGIKRLHLVDLDGARTGRPLHTKVVEQIASATDLKIDFSGGIKTRADVERAFLAGASYVTVGSLAVQDPDLFLLWLTEFGPERFILAADAKDGKVAINGWQTTTDVAIKDMLRSYASSSLHGVMVTDVAKDGAMSGPAFHLYESLLSSAPDLRLIASGGVRSVDDIQILARIGCSGVIVGKAFYEGHISLEEMAASAR